MAGPTESRRAPDVARDDPDDGRLRRLMQDGRLDKAIWRARRRVQRDRTIAQRWVLLGEVLERQHRPKAAWLAFDRASILDPQADWVEATRTRLQGPVTGACRCGCPNCSRCRARRLRAW
jgi:hypothetical protein